MLTGPLSLISANSHSPSRIKPTRNMLSVCPLLPCGCEVVLTELQIEVILSYFIIDWDASKRWTSPNRVYSWPEPFHKDGRHPTAAFTYTSKGDITEFAVLDAMDVERDSPVRKMIQNRDKTHSVELTYHILVKAFTRTGNSYLDFSQEDKDVIRKFSRKVTNEGKQTISDWFINVVCGAPFRALEVEPDPWSDDSFVSWFEG